MDKNLRPSIFKRLLALILDFIILGIIGFVSGLFLENFYVSLGKYGTLIGSAITLLYFSILQSKIGYGQTLGKKAIGAKVTDLKSEFLTLPKSFLRSSIIIIPIMNVQIFAGGKGGVLIMTLIILSLFASFYLIIVNKSRRCLHDILVPSIVTNQEVNGIEIEESNDRSAKKLVPFGIIAAAMMGITLYFSYTPGDFSQLLNVKEKIEANDGVIGVDEIKSGTTITGGLNTPSETYTEVKIVVRIRDQKEASNQESDYFDEVSQVIREEIPESQNVDRVTITLYYGYNIGIASKTKSVTKTIRGPLRFNKT